MDQRNLDTLIELNDIVNLCKKIQKKIMADDYKYPSSKDRELIRKVEQTLRTVLDS